MKYRAVLITGLFLAGRIFELSRGNDISIEIPTVFPDLVAPYSQPIAAPYGVIWYAIMEAIYYLSVPLSYVFQWDNYFSISAVILFVNCPVLAYISYNHKHLFPVYFLFSFHSWFPFTVWFTDINEKDTAVESENDQPDNGHVDVREPDGKWKPGMEREEEVHRKQVLVIV